MRAQHAERGAQTGEVRLDRRSDVRRRRSIARAAGVLAAAAFVAASLTSSSVEPPKEPITINLNIKLDADVRLRVEEQAKQDVAKEPIF